MNRPQTKPKQAAANEPTCWSLEVVRGRTIAQQFVLEAGETIVGNDLGGTRGLDLADQEGNTPRKMAARHAAITSTTQEITVRDLDSPGGTFVNQQRLLSGQARRLAAGDVIQLGSVQVRVKHNGVVSDDKKAGAVPAPAPAAVAPAKAPPAAPSVAARTAYPPAAVIPPSPTGAGRL
jgi:predicted component of type VI protein secretion system